MKGIKKTSGLGRFLPFLLQAPFPAQGSERRRRVQLCSGLPQQRRASGKEGDGEVRPLLKSGGSAVSARGSLLREQLAAALSLSGP